MFAAFFLRRRVRDAVRRIGATLSVSIGTLSATEKAATLAVANAVLMAVADDSGLPLASRPDRIDPEAARHLVDLVGIERDKVVRTIRTAGDTVSPEALAQATRQILAFDLVALTAASSLDSSVHPLVVGAWKDLLTARSSARKGMQALVTFAKATGTQPLPPRSGGRRWSGDDVVALASFPPPFLRTKTKARAAA